MKRSIGLLTALLTLSAMLIGVGSASAQTGAVAFTGATIETADKAGQIKDGVVVIRGGKFEAVGKAKDVKIPEDARVVEMNGNHIMPGVIDPYHAISVGGASAPAEVRTIVIGGRVFRVGGGSRTSPTTFTKIGENFYPYSFRSRILLRSGVTHINMVSGGYGQAALARNTPEKPESLLASSNGVMFATVTNSSTSLGLLRTGLGSTSKPSTSSSTSKPSTTTTTRRPPTTSSRSSSSSPSAALWKEVREGKRNLIVNANNAAGIQHLMELVEPHKTVKLVVVATGPNVYQTMDALKKRKPMMIMQPTIDLQPNSAIRLNVPRMVHEAGMPLAFSLSLSASQLSASQDAPLFRVAMLVRAGLPRKTALAALTSQPAKMIGLEKTHGSIAAGKTANLLVFDGDPLDPSSRLRHVYVEGNEVYEN